MKTQALLDTLKGILNKEHRAQLKKYRSLKKVLKGLSLEKNRLKAESKAATDELEKEDIAVKLKVVRAQRKKGLKLLKELKQTRKKSKN